jgi:hypothetical protein
MTKDEERAEKHERKEQEKVSPLSAHNIKKLWTEPLRT